jgi:hypothetical protein
MALVILPVKLPTDLVGADNGKLEPGLLVPVGQRGLLHHTAARAWAALVAAAARNGFNLTYTYGGTYRPYNDQETGFRARYQLAPLPGRPVKKWQGQTWYQKPGVEMAAVPGTSNHGLGIAIDTALDYDLTDGVGPNDAANIAPALDWLSVNAPLFGFSWESYETWHIRYVAGDRIPQAVLDHERPPTPVPPQEDDDMLPIVTNAEPHRGEDPFVWKWALMDDGNLRHLDGPEHQLRGAKRGEPWTNDVLAAHGAPNA